MKKTAVATDAVNRIYWRKNKKKKQDYSKLFIRPSA